MTTATTEQAAPFRAEVARAQARTTLEYLAHHAALGTAFYVGPQDVEGIRFLLSPEGLAAEVEAHLQSAISASPQPLQDLGNLLCSLLDEDQWKAAEALLLAIGMRPQPTSPALMITEDMIERGAEGVRRGEALPRPLGYAQADFDRHTAKAVLEAAFPQNPPT